MKCRNCENRVPINQYYCDECLINKKCKICKRITINEKCNECIILEENIIKFCPNCGYKLPKELSKQLPFTNPYNGDYGYDIWCKNCEWGGEIYPYEIMERLKDE